MAGDLQSKTLSQYLGLPEPQQTNNYANLDSSTTNVSGINESNSNKIWNDVSPAELQMKIGDTIGNYAITADAKGNKTQMVDGQVVPFTGETRRFYSYGTQDKANPDAVKFGLSSGRYNTSDARYDPVLGWAPGQSGVDVGKKIVDVELPYDKAIELEASIHGNKTAMNARLARLNDAKQKKLLGSGYTEYYKSMEGVLGNVANQDLASVEVPRIMDTATQTKAYNQSGLTNVVDAQGNRVFDPKQYQAPESPVMYGRSIDNRVINTAKAAGTSFTKGLYDVADVASEVVGSDLGTEAEKQKQVDKLFGYDRSYQAKSNEKIGKLVDNMSKNGYTVDGVADVIKEGFNTWENFGDSIGFVASLAIGGPTSIAGKGVVAAAKGVKAAEALGDAAKLAEATRRLETAREQYFGTQKALDFVSKNSGLFSVSAGTANDDLDEYAKKAKISKSEVGAEKMVGAYLGSLVSNTIDKVTDLGILRSPEFSSGLIQVIKGMTDKQLEQMGKGLATAAVAMGTSAAKEGPTEYVQQFLEQVNEQVGEKTGKTIADAWNDEQNKKERVIAGLQGVSGAGQMTAASTVGHVGSIGATSAAGKVINKLAEKASTSTEAVVYSTVAPNYDFGAEVATKQQGLDEAIADGKIGTATKLFNSLNADMPKDTGGLINRDKMLEYKSMLQEKHNEIKQRIADNNGVLDDTTVQMLGSDKESLSGIVDSIDTNVLEEAVMNGRITDESVLKQVNGTITVRKSLEQVGDQVVGDFARYWKTFNDSTDERVKDIARISLARLTSNEVEKLDSMQATVQELEADIRSDMINRRDQGIVVKLSDYGDIDGKGIVAKYPAGGEYQIHRRNIAEKVMSELAGREPVKNGIYKIIDAVANEVDAAKKITGVTNSIAEDVVANEVPTVVPTDATSQEIIPTSEIAGETVTEPSVPVQPIVNATTSRVKKLTKAEEDFIRLYPTKQLTATRTARYNRLIEQKRQYDAQIPISKVTSVDLSYEPDTDKRVSAVKTDMQIKSDAVKERNYGQSLSDADLAELDRMYQEELKSTTVVDNEQVVDQNIEVPVSPVVDTTEVLVKKDTGIDLSKLTSSTKTMFDAKVENIRQVLDKVVYSNVVSSITINESPMQMLMVKENGKWVYPTKVIEAITLSMSNYLAERYSSLLYNDDTQIQKMLGVTGRVNAEVRSVMSKVGRLHDLEADTLGRMILKEAGIATNGNVADYDLQARMAVDAGTIAFAVMENLGLISSKQELTVDRMKYLVDSIDGSTGNQTYPAFDIKQAVRTITINPRLTLGTNPKWIQYAKHYQEFTKAIATETETEGFVKKPRNNITGKTIEFKTRNAENWTNITETQQEILNTAENTEFTVNTDAVRLLESMWGNLIEQGTELSSRQIEVAKLFGWDTFEDKHIDSQDGVRAKNADIVNSIQQLITFSKENADSSVYFDYFFSKNGRFFIDSGTINPQTDKLHRFIVTIPVDNEVIDNEISRVAFKTAVVQAFDGSKVVTWSTGIESDSVDVDEEGAEIRGLGSIDKQGQEANLKQFEAIRLNAVVDEAVKAISSDDVDTSDKILAAIQGVDHPGHAIVALQELAKYNETEPFSSKMTIETDGVTSGFLLGLITNPIMEFSKLAKWIAKGGVWLGDSQYKTYGEWKEAGNRDSYETSADGIQKALEQDKYLVGNSNVLRYVGKVDRKFMKNPLMIFVYGAGLGKIRNEIAQKYADKMVEDLSKDDAIDEMLGMVKDSVDGLIELKNSEEIKNDKSKVSKIDFIIGKQTAAGKWLEVLNRRGDVAKVIKDTSLSGKGSGNLQMLHSIVKNQVNAVYGAEVGNYLQKEFGELVEMRRMMNDVFQVSFDVFKTEYDLRIDAEKGNRSKPTQAMIDSVLGRMVNEGKIPGILTVEANSIDEKAPTLKRLKISSKDGASKVQSKLKNADGARIQRTVHPMVYDIVANSAAGSVINIHYLDGAIIGKIIADSQGFGVHDAFVAHVNKISDNVKKYNENVFIMTQEYDMLQRVLNELDRVHELDPTSVEEYYAKKSEGDVEVTFDSTREGLQSLVDTVKANKELLANSKLTVTQMAGIEGTMYTRDAGQVDANKPDSVGQIMASAGVIRDTKGMAKDISDKIAEAIKKDCRLG